MEEKPSAKEKTDISSHGNIRFLSLSFGCRGRIHMEIPPAVGAEFPLINVMDRQASAAVTANPMAKINKCRCRNEGNANPHQWAFSRIIPCKNRIDDAEQTNQTTKTHPSSGSVQTHFLSS